MFRKRPHTYARSAATLVISTRNEELLAPKKAGKKSWGKSSVCLGSSHNPTSRGSGRDSKPLPLVGEVEKEINDKSVFVLSSRATVDWRLASRLLPRSDQNVRTPAPIHPQKTSVLYLSTERFFFSLSAIQLSILILSAVLIQSGSIGGVGLFGEIVVNPERRDCGLLMAAGECLDVRRAQKKEKITLRYIWTKVLTSTVTPLAMVLGKEQYGKPCGRVTICVKNLISGTAFPPCTYFNTLQIFWQCYVFNKAGLSLNKITGYLRWIVLDRSFFWNP